MLINNRVRKTAHDIRRNKVSSLTRNRRFLSSGRYNVSCDDANYRHDEPHRVFSCFKSPSRIRCDYKPSSMCVYFASDAMVKTRLPLIVWPMVQHIVQSHCGEQRVYNSNLYYVVTQTQGAKSASFSGDVVGIWFKQSRFTLRKHAPLFNRE